MISFTVFGNPVPKARPRLFFNRKTGRGGAYTPKGTVRWEDAIRLEALAHRPDTLLDGPLSLTLVFILQKPPSLPKKRTLPDRKPDLSNLIKSVEDAMEGVIFTNDSRIVRFHAAKFYGNPPLVMVKVEGTAEGDDRGGL